MAWTHYRLVFRLESSLHIGYRKVGNLMQTRRYVPGKNLWGALTARLVRDAGRGNDPQAYRVMGEAVRACFRFGYLYPAIPRPNNPRTPDDVEPYFPWQAREVPFDYLFLNSYASTALDYESISALAGSLHETEFISPHTRPLRDTAWEGTRGEEADTLGLPVYLVGDLWVVEDCKNHWLEKLKSDEIRERLKSADDLLKLWCGNQLNNWREALKQIQLGGERGYGWGRVKLLDGGIEEDDDLVIPGWQWDKSATEQVVLQANAHDDGEIHLPAHALAADENGKAFSSDEIQGPIEPLVGRETRMDEKPGFGTTLSRARICWNPGSKVQSTLRACVDWDGVLMKEAR